MSQRDDVYAALQKADAAGDTAGAKQLADYIRTMPADNAPAADKIEATTGKTYGQLQNELSAFKSANGVQNVNQQQLAKQTKLSQNATQSYLQNDPTKQGSTLQFLGADTGINLPAPVSNTLAGAGAMYNDIGLRGKQLYAKAADLVSPSISSLVTGQSREDQVRQQIAEARQINDRLDSTTGGKIGRALALAPAAYLAPATVPGAAVSGLATSELQPTMNNKEELINPILGTALSAGTQYGLNQLGDYASNALTQNAANTAGGLTDAQQLAAAAGDKLGMKLTPGQATGNKALQQLEARLESTPYTSGPINAIKKGNQEVLNNTWAKAIGQDGKSVDSSVLADAAENLSNQFEKFRSPNVKVIIDPAKTSAVINSVDEGLQGLYPGSIKDNPLVQQLDKLAQNGAMTGEELGKLSSKLGKAAYKQTNPLTGDHDYASALYQIKDHVDDMLGASLSKTNSAAYAQTRQQWRALKQITDRINNVNPSTGNINGVSMANALQKKDVGGFLYGKNQSPQYAATRFAQAFKPVVGDSGTATRSMGLGDAAIAIPAWAASQAYFSKPSNALITALSKTNFSSGPLKGADFISKNLRGATLAQALQGAQ